MYVFEFKRKITASNLVDISMLEYNNFNLLILIRFENLYLLTHVLQRNASF